MIAVGVHCFAGGFVAGVKRTIEVVAQLETLDLGRETAPKRVPFHMIGEPKDWPHFKCDFVFGNPRCTAFSALTCGRTANGHGPNGAVTRDIRELCDYGLAVDATVVAWESVQGAIGVGRPLVDELVREKFTPAGYRVAHLLVNAATFGNAQYRRRYFFVAYRGGNFNVRVPPMPARKTTVSEPLAVAASLAELPVEEHDFKTSDYHPDCYAKLPPDERVLVPYLEQGQDVNAYAAANEEEFMRVATRKYRDRWRVRCSKIPFGLHCPRRLQADGYSPTLHTSACKLVHPTEDRPLTVREIATIMGWPSDDLPEGPLPVEQIVKGVDPDVGEWLADQVARFLEGQADRRDLAVEHRKDGWYEVELDGSPTEKVVNMTHLAR